MKNQIIALVCIFGTAICHAQETPSPQAPSTKVVTEKETTKKPMKKCKRDGYTSRDATVLSMMGWGVSIAIGIAAFCALMDDNKATTTTTGT